MNEPEALLKELIVVCACVCICVLLFNWSVCGQSVWCFTECPAQITTGQWPSFNTHTHTHTHTQREAIMAWEAIDSLAWLYLSDQYDTLVVCCSVRDTRFLYSLPLTFGTRVQDQ